MATSIVTIEDLKRFKIELIDELKTFFSENQPLKAKAKKWLKSYEVRDLLGISPGTLQNLRINGTLPYSRIGGAIYYDNDEIQKILAENRIHNVYRR
jgi:hypothetical protein